MKSDGDMELGATNIDKRDWSQKIDRQLLLTESTEPSTSI